MVKIKIVKFIVGLGNQDYVYHRVVLQLISNKIQSMNSYGIKELFNSL